MEYVTLKNSDLRVSRLCMGGCPLGGHGWGTSVSENELIKTVHSALDCGITFFDTADCYGLGQSETILGRALKNRRTHVVIATKFGVRADGGNTYYDNSPKWIEEACKASLKRLNTEYIDLYQIHYRDGLTPIEEVMGMLGQLQKKGYIRYCGISNVHIDSVEEFKPYIGKLISFQDEYSLARRANEKDIQELSVKMQMTPMTWGSLGQGILTGKYDRNSSFGDNDRRSRREYVNFHGKKLEHNLQIVETLKEIALAHDRDISASAIRFILDYLQGSVVLFGAKHPDQVISNTGAFGWRLSKEEVNMLLNISDETKWNNSVRGGVLPGRQ